MAFEEIDYKGTHLAKPHTPFLTEIAALVAATGATAVTDPGDAGAIAGTGGGTCALTSGAVGETRTLAIPTAKGKRLTIFMDTDGGGAIAITVAAAINPLGNTIITMADAGDMVELVGVTVGSALRWSVVSNNGCALS